MIATRDNYTAECMYRLFAFQGEQQADEPWEVILNLSCLKSIDDPLRADLEKIYPVQPARTEAQRKAKVQNLLEASMRMLSPATSSGLLIALDAFALTPWLSGGQASNDRQVW